MAWRALVVDDDVVVGMRLSFSDEDIEVTDAVRIADALPTAMGGDFDVAIIDRRMPDGDGLDLVRALRDHPETAELPIIMLTAFHGEADRDEVLEAGADEYLAKPIEPDQLVTVFRRLTGVEDDADATPDKKEKKRERRRHRPLRRAHVANDRPAPTAPSLITQPPPAPEREALTTEAATMLYQLAAARDAIAELRSYSEAQESDNAELEEEVAHADASVNKLEQQLGEAEATAADLRRRIAHAEASITKVEQLLANAEAGGADFRGEPASIPIDLDREASRSTAQTVIDLRDATNRLLERTHDRR